MPRRSKQQFDVIFEAAKAAAPAGYEVVMLFIDTNTGHVAMEFNHPDSSKLNHGQMPTFLHKLADALDRHDKARWN